MRRPTVFDVLSAGSPASAGIALIVLGAALVALAGCGDLFSPVTSTTINNRQENPPTATPSPTPSPTPFCLPETAPCIDNHQCCGANCTNGVCK